MYIVGDPKNIQNDERKRFYKDATHCISLEIGPTLEGGQGTTTESVFVSSVLCSSTNIHGMLTTYNKYLIWISIILSGGSYWII
jgi:hypothetical protein